MPQYESKLNYENELNKLNCVSELFGVNKSNLPVLSHQGLIVKNQGRITGLRRIIAQRGLSARIDIIKEVMLVVATNNRDDSQMRDLETNGSS